MPRHARFALLSLLILAVQLPLLPAHDYQDRGKLGALFDQVPAYAVVSTIPASNAGLAPGQTVVLGVRAP